MKTTLLPTPCPMAEISVESWLNAPPDFSLRQLRGHVVVLHTFQLLCPGCVAHGIPQAKAIEATLGSAGVCVVGLHTVFEHHEAMQENTLRAFLHEYRVGHPVGVDAPSRTGPVPVTMGRLNLRGTPSLLLLDRQGALRASHFGRVSDLLVGAQLGSLLREKDALLSEESALSEEAALREEANLCTSDQCKLNQ